MRPTRLPAPLVAAALLATAATGCVGEGDVTGVVFTATERMTGDGPLGTCSFETRTDPLPEADAERLTWSVGAVVGVTADFTQACGGATGGACAPVTGYEWFLVGKPDFAFEEKPVADLNGLEGEVAGLLTAAGANTGGIGVKYAGGTFGPIAMEAFLPDRLKLTSFESWDGDPQGPQESVLAETVKAGSTMNVLLRPVDKSGGRLCGRGPVDATGTTGITLSGDPSLGAAEPQANSVIVLTFGQAGTATLKLSFGGASVTQEFDVRP